MPDFPELSYGTVHGRFLAGLLDAPHIVNPLATPAPDAEPLSGSVVFSATASVILVDQSLPEPVTFMPQPLRVHLDDEGYLSLNGSRDVNLWATDDPSGNPVDWQWHVHFELHHNGRGVYRQPFNFALPAGSIVDLTTVAPLTVLSDGTVIIRGPAGPPGPSALDLIDAKGDLVAGTADNAAAVVPVGQPGQFLTPNPAIPTGLEWQDLPVPDAGLKVYASLAEAEAVRTAEIGTLHIPDLAAAFPNLAAVGSGVEASFPVGGSADLVITTTTSKSPLANPGYQVLHQKFSIGHTMAMDYDESIPIVRVFLWGAGLNSAGHQWWPDLSHLPLPEGAQWLPMSELDPVSGWYKWGLAYASYDALADTLVRREPSGRAQIKDPQVPLDIANKQWTEAQIAAIPAPELPPHTHPEIGGTHRFLLNAAPAGDPGAGRVGIVSAGGQNRTLFVSKTDADGGDVFLAPLAVNDSLVLVNEGDPSPTIYARGYASSVVTDAGTHWEFSAVRESGVGALPGDGTSMLLTITMANGAGAAVPTGGALAEYNSAAEAAAPHVGEVGVWHIPNLSLEFPYLIASFPNGEFSGTGPADIVITTTVQDHPSDLTAVAGRRTVLQTIWVPNAVGGQPFHILQRVGTWDDISQTWVYVLNQFQKLFNPMPNAPNGDQMLVSSATYPYGWVMVQSGEAPYNSSILRRDSKGRGKVYPPDHNSQPTDPLHIVNKDYLDRSIAAAIATLRTELGLP